MRNQVFALLFILYINIRTASGDDVATAGENRAGWPGYKYYPELQGWLKLHREPTDYQDARVTCDMEEALMAAEWNAEFTKAIVALVPNTQDESGSALYSGAQVSFSNGVYSYVKGKPILNLDKSLVLNRCIIFCANGTTAEVECQQRYPFVCFAPAPACGLDETSGYSLSSETGHCYKYHSALVNWTTAYRTCHDEGAYLSVVNSQAEARFLVSLIPSDITTVIIGFYYRSPAEKWWTVKGQTIEQAGFNTWRSREPTSGAYRGFLHRDGQLFSYYYGTTSPFICEKEPVLINSSS